MRTWLILLLATGLTAVVGIEEGGNSTTVGLVLIAIAFLKLRLVAIHFMEVRTAPRLLRFIVEGYVIAVFAVLAVLYVAVS